MVSKGAARRADSSSHVTEHFALHSHGHHSVPPQLRVDAMLGFRFNLRRNVVGKAYSLFVFLEPTGSPCLARTSAGSRKKGRTRSCARIPVAGVM